MKKAFKRFEEIDLLDSVVQKHKAWLEDYKGEGIIYSIAEDKKHKMKWSTEKKTYKEFQTEINMIGRLPFRTIIEFDDEPSEKAKENLEKVYEKLKESGLGFIRSTHKGKSDYLWIEFNRDLEDSEVKTFLNWVSPAGAKIDLNFASSKKVFAVMYAPHWKYSFERETPIEYFEGEQIDYDSLELKENKDIEIFEEKDGFIYHTLQKASSLFTKDKQAKEFTKIQPLFYDRAGMFWLWNSLETKWEIVDETDMLNMINEATGKDTINSKSRTEILNSLKQEGRKRIPKDIKKTWIQFKNKIYDISTGENFEATPEYFVTNPIPWNISGDPQTPVMDKIFKEWVGEEYVPLLYEILAYSLLPDYPINRLFCFIGSGMNGKSKFLELLHRFVGPDNVCSTELDSLIGSRFEVTRLHKKLVCMMGETNFNEMSKTSIIKKLTGGDLIGFEYKNKNPFEDHNYAKIIIATNNLPTTTDKTLGFYRRWCIIDFPNSFSEKKDILIEIPKEEYNNLATNSIIVLNELLKNREFTNEGTIEERAEKYEAKSNFLRNFLDLFVEEDFNEWITVNDFNKKFASWCKENRHRELSETSLGLQMKKLGNEQERKYFNWMFDGKGGQARVWSGIKWKN